MSEGRSLWQAGKWGLILLHFLLAIAFNFATPFRTEGFQHGKYMGDIGAPDELAHVKYVEHVLREKSLPVLVPGQPETAVAYQSHQAPLFYFLNAAWCRLAGFTDLESQAAGRWARVQNAVFGGLFVSGAFSLGRRMSGRMDVGCFTASVVAFLPMNLALSGALSNDPLLFATCTWALALGVCPESKRDLWLAGLCAGLAILTKTTAIALIPTFLVAALFTKSPGAPSGTNFHYLRKRDEVSVDRDRASRSNAGRAPALLGVPLALGSIWWIRNWQVYGDPLAQSVFLAQFKPDAPALVSVESVLRWGYDIVRVSFLSLIGQFGYMDIHTPIVLVVICLGLMGACTLAGVRKADIDRRNTVLIVFAVLVVLLYVRFNMTYVQPQARYCFPALAPLAYLWARSLVEDFPWERRACSASDRYLGAGSGQPSGSDAPPPHPSSLRSQTLSPGGEGIRRRRLAWALPIALLITSIINLARLPGEFDIRIQQLVEARQQGIVK